MRTAALGLAVLPLLAAGCGQAKTEPPVAGPRQPLLRDVPVGRETDDPLVGLVKALCLPAPTSAAVSARARAAGWRRVAVSPEITTFSRTLDGVEYRLATGPMRMPFAGTSGIADTCFIGSATGDLARLQRATRGWLGIPPVQNEGGQLYAFEDAAGRRNLPPLEGATRDQAIRFITSGRFRIVKAQTEDKVTMLVYAAFRVGGDGPMAFARPAAPPSVPVTPRAKQNLSLPPSCASMKTKDGDCV